MARAWAAAMYPHSVHRDRKADPATVCMKAAVLAGEEQFSTSILLPLLRSNETSEKNRLLSQKVICSIF
jgi:hypothetical protein